MFSLRKTRKWIAALVFFISAKSVLAAGEAVTLIPTEKDNPDLAEAFMTGKFELWQLGDYVQYLIEVLIFFAGGIAVLFVVIGGYKYLIGSVAEDKEGGKKTIGYALGGLAIAVLAWTIVNVLQVWLTSGGQ